MGATTGQFGAVWAQAELRKVLGSTGARVVDAEVGLALADDAFDENGRLRDESSVDAIRDLTSAVIAEAERDRELAQAA